MKRDPSDTHATRIMWSGDRSPVGEELVSSNMLDAALHTALHHFTHPHSSTLPRRRGMSPSLLSIRPAR